MTLFRQTRLCFSQHVLSTFDAALQDLPVQRHTDTLFEREKFCTDKPAILANVQGISSGQD
jgi:hypothetical protein